jgi:hypothetical protein
VDTNPRYRYDNILGTELDMPEKTTQEFAGPGMKSRVDQILAMDINGDDGDDVTYNTADAIPSPYLSYEQVAGSNEDARSMRNNGAGSGGATSSRPKTGKKSSSKSSSASGSAGASAAADYNNYSSAGASSGQYYSGSSAGASAGRSEGRPKSATRRRDEGGASSSAGASGYGRADEPAAYKGGNSRYVPDEEQYPTARGLIRK